MNELQLNLTLTSVVFELVGLIIGGCIGVNLTLTSVVFEFYIIIKASSFF